MTKKKNKYYTIYSCNKYFTCISDIKIKYICQEEKK